MGTPLYEQFLRESQAGGAPDDAPSDTTDLYRAYLDETKSDNPLTRVGRQLSELRNKVKGYGDELRGVQQTYREENPGVSDLLSGVASDPSHNLATRGAAMAASLPVAAIEHPLETANMVGGMVVEPPAKLGQYAAEHVGPAKDDAERRRRLIAEHEARVDALLRNPNPPPTLDESMAQLKDAAGPPVTPPVTNREAGFAAAQLATLEGAGPLGRATQRLVGGVPKAVSRTVLEEGAMLPEKMPLSPRRAAGIVAGHAVPGAAIGAAYTPEDPAVGAVGGAALGAASAVVGARAPSASIIEGGPAASARVVGPPPPEPPPYDQPESITMTLRRAQQEHAARAQQPPPAEPPGAGPAGPAAPRPRPETPPESRAPEAKPRVVFRVSPIDEHGAEFTSEAPGDAGAAADIAYDAQRAHIADGTDPETAHAILQEARMDPALSEVDRGEVEMLARRHRPAVPSAPWAIAAAHRLGYDGFRPAHIDLDAPAPPTRIWSIRKLKPVPMPARAEHGFTTAKGSTYVVRGEATERNKAPRPEHPGDAGPQPPSQRTLYVDQAGLNALSEMQARGPKRVIAPLGDGRWGLRYVEGPNAGKFEQRTVVKPHPAPAVGLYPVELWNDGAEAHFGNEITEVRGAPENVTVNRHGRGQRRAARAGTGRPGESGAPDAGGVWASAVPEEAERFRRRPGAPAEGAQGELAQRPRIEGADGHESDVFLSSGSSVKARYRVVDARDLQASHDPLTFDPNPDYPEGVQGRAYHGSRGTAARQHVETETGRLRPEVLLDRGGGLTDGPPLVTPHGIVVAGNQRGMMLQRATVAAPEAYDRYRQRLRASAHSFGIAPSQFAHVEHPVLVRELNDDTIDVNDPAALGELNRISDQAPTKSKDQVSAAMSRAHAMQEATSALNHLAETMDPESTVREYVGTAAGREFVRHLVQDGVISKQEIPQFVDVATNMVHAHGRQAIEDMMYAAAIGDADVFSRAPADALRKLGPSIPAFIAAHGTGKYSLQPDLKEALDLMASAAAMKEESGGGGKRSVADVLDQGDAFGRAVQQNAADLARFIETRSAKDVAAAIRTYAKLAAEASQRGQSEDIFGDKPASPDELRRRVFGEDKRVAERSPEYLEEKARGRGLTDEEELENDLKDGLITEDEFEQTSAWRRYQTFLEKNRATRIRGDDIPTFEEWLDDEYGRDDATKILGRKPEGRLETIRDDVPIEPLGRAPEKYEYSSTQFDLPDDIADEVRELGRRIPDSALAKDGREEHPHVTVKYGLHDEHPERVKRVVDGHGPMTLTLGRASVFPAKDANGADIVKLEVKSPQLHALNATVARLPNDDEHPTYKPHVTIAYVKPGQGAKYARQVGAALEGREITVGNLTFSSKNGQQTTVPLRGGEHLHRIGERGPDRYTAYYARFLKEEGERFGGKGRLRSDKFTELHTWMHRVEKYLADPATPKASRELLTRMRHTLMPLYLELLDKETRRPATELVSEPRAGEYGEGNRRNDHDDREDEEHEESTGDRVAGGRGAAGATGAGAGGAGVRGAGRAAAGKEGRAPAEGGVRGGEPGERAGAELRGADGGGDGLTPQERYRQEMARRGRTMPRRESRPAQPSPREEEEERPQEPTEVVESDESDDEPTLDLEYLSPDAQRERLKRSKAVDEKTGEPLRLFYPTASAADDPYLNPERADYNAPELRPPRHDSINAAALGWTYESARQALLDAGWTEKELATRERTIAHGLWGPGGRDKRKRYPGVQGLAAIQTILQYEHDAMLMFGGRHGDWRPEEYWSRFIGLVHTPFTLFRRFGLHMLPKAKPINLKVYGVETLYHHPVYANIQRPLRLPDGGAAPWTYGALRDALIASGRWTAAEIDRHERAQAQGQRYREPRFGLDALRALLTQKPTKGFGGNYDGLVYRTSDGRDAWVALDSKQVEPIADELFGRRMKEHEVNARVLARMPAPAAAPAASTKPTSGGYTREELAEKADVRRSLIDHFVRNGLIDAPSMGRSARYPAAALQQVKLAQRLRAEGVSVEQIRRMRERGETSVPDSERRLTGAQLAERTGIPERTIKWYAQHGLIQQGYPLGTEAKLRAIARLRDEGVRGIEALRRRLSQVREKDLFGYEPEEERGAQESMFGEKEGTAAARNLEQTVRAARAELPKLKQQLEGTSSLVDKTRIARRIAELEKLVNRDKAISLDEMRARAVAAEREASGANADPLSVTCPDCHAAPGEPCVTGGRHVIRLEPHAVRRDLAIRDAKARNAKPSSAHGDDQELLLERSRPYDVGVGLKVAPNEGTPDLLVIPCGSAKVSGEGKVPAAELYVGPYFRAALAYARTVAPDKNIRILSAKHGLLRLDEMVAPYDVKMGDKKAIGPVELRSQIRAEGRLLKDRPDVRVIGGKEYVDLVGTAFPAARRVMPAGLGIGEQLGELKRLTAERRGEAPAREEESPKGLSGTAEQMRLLERTPPDYDLAAKLAEIKKRISAGEEPQLKAMIPGRGAELMTRLDEYSDLTSMGSWEWYEALPVKERRAMEIDFQRLNHKSMRFGEFVEKAFNDWKGQVFEAVMDPKRRVSERQLRPYGGTPERFARAGERDGEDYGRSEKEQLDLFRQAMTDPSSEAAKRAAFPVGSVKKWQAAVRELESSLDRIRRAGFTPGEEREAEMRDAPALTRTMVGRDISTPDKLRREATIIRHPLMEHWHYVIREKATGRAVDHVIGSSGMANFADIPWEVVDQIERTIVGFGKPDDYEVIELHNHPSGDVRESTNDEEHADAMAVALKHRGITYAGQMVTDHDAANWMTPRKNGFGVQTHRLSVPGADRDAPWKTTVQRGIRFQRPEEMAAYVRDAVEPNAHTALWLDGQRRVAAVVPLPASIDIVAYARELTKNRRRYGASELVIATDAYNAKLLAAETKTARGAAEPWAHYLLDVLEVTANGEKTPDVRGLVDALEFPPPDRDAQERIADAAPLGAGSYRDEDRGRAAAGVRTEAGGRKRGSGGPGRVRESDEVSGLHGVDGAEARYRAAYDAASRGELDKLRELGIEVRPPGDHSGLFGKWGLPNAVPKDGYHAALSGASTAGSIYVDDDAGGQPKVFVPEHGEPEPVETERKSWEELSDAEKARVLQLPTPTNVRQALYSLDYLGFDRAADALEAIRTHPDWRERWDVRSEDAKNADLIDAYVRRTTPRKPGKPAPLPQRVTEEIEAQRRRKDFRVMEPPAEYGRGGEKDDREPIGSMASYGDVETPRESGFGVEQSRVRPAVIRRSILSLFNPELLGRAGSGAAGTLRAESAAMFREIAIAEEALRALGKRVGKMSRKEALKFWDAAERGLATGDPFLDEGNRTLRRVTEIRTKQLIAFDRLAMEAATENYIGRFWNVPDGRSANDFLRVLLGKRPIEGPKSFLKQRSWEYFVDGLKAIEAAKKRLKDDAYPKDQRGEQDRARDEWLSKVRPVTYNYVDSQLAKLAEMDRLIAAEKMKRFEQERGRAVKVLDGHDEPRTPDGRSWLPIDPTGKDPAFIVWGPREGMVKLPAEAKAAGVKPGDVEVFGSRRIGKWFAHPDAAPVWHAHLSQGIRSHPLWGPLYQAYMAPANASVQIILGFSGFHFMNIAREGINSRLALSLDDLVNKGGSKRRALVHAVAAPAAVVQDARFGRKIMQEFRKPGTHPQLERVLRVMVEGGFRGQAASEFWTGERLKALKKSFKDAVDKESTTVERAKGVATFAWELPWALIETQMKPLMEYYVPWMKAAATYRAVAQMMENLPAVASTERLRVKMGDVVKEMDYRYGHVVYDNHFMNRIIKDLAQGLFLAPGWTFGWLTLGGRALRDLAKLPGQARERWRGNEQAGEDMLGKSAAVIAAGLVFYMLLNAIITYLHTGEQPEGKDFFAFRDGTKDRNGNWNRHVLPGAEMRDFYAWATEPVKTATHKLKPGLSFLYRLLSNRTYYGDLIYDPEASTATKAKQIAKEAAKELGTPISVQNYLEARDRGGAEGPSEVARTSLGVSPSKREFQRTPAQNLLYEYLARRGKDAHTPEEAQSEQERRQLRNELRDARATGNQDSVRSIVGQLREARQAHDLTRGQFQSMVRTTRQVPLETAFGQLTYDEMVRVYEKGEPWEQAIWYRLLHRKAIATGNMRDFRERNLTRPEAVNQ